MSGHTKKSGSLTKEKVADVSRGRKPSVAILTPSKRGVASREENWSRVEGGVASREENQSRVEGGDASRGRRPSQNPSQNQSSAVQNTAIGSTFDAEDDATESVQQDVMDIDTLTSYVSYARKHIHQEISDEAAEELIRGYVEMRRRGNFPCSSKKLLEELKKQSSLGEVHLNDVNECYCKSCK